MAKQSKLSEMIEKETGGVTGAVAEQGLLARVEKSKGRQKSYTLDLRIHSPASLGYLGVDGLDTAPALVRLAKVKGLDVIAVTDFYSGSFVDRVAEAAKNSPVTVIPGVVIRCVIGECRDVTMLCLFSEGTNSIRIEEFLHQLGVPASAFGDRRYTVTTPLEEILAIVERFSGVAVPSRMDKTPHRATIIPLLVEKYGFRAFDLAYADSAKSIKSRWPKIKFQLFSFSNANALAQVGSRSAKVKLHMPGFEGIRQLVMRESAGESRGAR